MVKQKVFTTKLNIRGFKKTLKSLQPAIIRALKLSATVVERKAKIYAPYDTGTLSRSIKKTGVTIRSNEDSISIGPSVKYGEIMERTGRVRRRGRRPYMEPALRDSIDKIKQIMEREFKGMVKKA